MTRGPGEERQQCLLGDPSSSGAKVIIVLLLLKDIYLTLFKKQLSVLCAQLLLQRNPVYVNILIKYTKRYVILVIPVKKATLLSSL